jgi:hypothetical protein
MHVRVRVSHVKIVLETTVNNDVRLTAADCHIVNSFKIAQLELGLDNRSTNIVYSTDGLN